MGPLKILLLDQVVITIKEFLSKSRKHYAIYDSSTYRNLFPNQVVHLRPLMTVADSGARINTATLMDPGTVAAVTVVGDAGTGAVPSDATLTERIVVDDSVAAVEPRIWKKIRTRVEFWSGAEVGTEFAASVTTTSGSATIVVGSNVLFTPGQAISGTGIPTGAIVAEVPFAAPTTVILSHQATASGTVVATLTGSDYVGGYWEDEALGDGDEINILQ